MSKRVLSVGQCGPDSAAIDRLISGRFDAVVDRADLPQDAREKLLANEYDLVLVNRKLDADYSDGLEIVKSVKADPRTAKLPVMLVTNYAEHQQAAVAAGAEYGFGKLEYDLPATIEKLKKFLG